jgi:hypothetical protein
MTDSPYDDMVPEAQTESNQEEITMETKSIFQSKTFWINAITAVAGILTTIGGSDLIQQNPQAAGVMAIVIGVANVLLRLVTKQPVKVL